MDIKALLEALGNGEKTIDEVVTAINKETVPYTRFSEKVQEVKTLKNDLTTRDEQLKTLQDSAGDNQTLKDTITKLQQDNETAKANYEAELAGVKLQAAIDTALLTNKARNPATVKALLDMDTIKLDGDNVLGLSEQLEKIQESDGYLFDIGDSSQQQQHQQRKGEYGTGLTGRGNTPPPPPDAFEAGKQRALERHAARLQKEEN